MLRIRLRRVGAKKQASFRVVVADQRAPRDGRFVEIIGHYNPRTDPIAFRIDEERALYWLSQGAQPSDAVERLLKKSGTRDRLSRLQAGESLEALVAEAEEQPTSEAQVRSPAEEPAAEDIAEAAEETEPEVQESSSADDVPEEPEVLD